MKRIFWLVVLLAAIGALVTWRFGKSERKSSPTGETALYRIYSNQVGKFRMLVPEGWETEEATPGGAFTTRAVFRPRLDAIKIGNIGELAVTVVATPAVGQPLSTQAEFDLWDKSPVGGATSEGYFKVASETLSGLPAVRIAEVEPIPDEAVNKFWSQTIWMRKDEVNYYVNMAGNGPVDWGEEPEFFKMLESFELLP